MAAPPVPPDVHDRLTVALAATAMGALGSGGRPTTFSVDPGALHRDQMASFLASPSKNTREYQVPPTTFEVETSASVPSPANPCPPPPVGWAHGTAEGA